MSFLAPSRLFQVVSGRFLLLVGRSKSFFARCRSFQAVSCSFQVVLVRFGSFRVSKDVIFFVLAIIHFCNVYFVMDNFCFTFRSNLRNQ